MYKRQGFNTLNVQIRLSEETLLKSARAFLIFQELESQGEIIKSKPTIEDIETENFDFDIYFLLVTKKSAQEISDIVENISEVVSVTVEDVDIDIEDLEQEEAQVQKSEVVATPVKPKDIATKKAPEVKREPRANNKKAHQSVRVDLQRIDTLMNMVSELVIYRTRPVSYTHLVNNERLRESVKMLNDKRLERVQKIITNLKEYDIQLEIDELYKNNNETLGRSHIANAMVEKGYFANYKQAFQNFLIKGKPGYERGFKLSYKEAIDIIKSAGGVAVLARCV